MQASCRRLWRLIRKELSQVLRDRRMLGLIFAMPVLELFIFGYVASTDINHIQTAVLDEDRSFASREFIDRLRGSGYFIFTGFLGGERDATTHLERGISQVVLRLPKGFGQDLARGRTARVQTLFDGSDSMSASIINAYVNQIVQEYASEFADKNLARLRQRLPGVPGIEPRIRVWFNPELRSVVFMVPGVLCLILFLVTMIETALSIVKEKEVGTLEQIIVTPIRSWEFIVGKTLPYFFSGLITLALILVVAIGWFRVVPVGSIWLLLGLACIFLMTSLGLGMFISTISETQQEAVISSFFFLFPMIMLSGLIFPIDNMPPSIQVLTRIIPLRYFLEIIRAVYLKGAGMAIIWKQTLILAAFGFGILTLAVSRFSKRLD